MDTWMFLWKKKLFPYHHTNPGTMSSLLPLMHHLQSLAGFIPYPVDKKNSKQSTLRNKKMLA
jgi:hypothetical protein